MILKKYLFILYSIPKVMLIYCKLELFMQAFFAISPKYFFIAAQQAVISGCHTEFLLTLHSRIVFFNRDGQDIQIDYITFYPVHPVHPC